MARLFRPHVPLTVRCQVAERQAAARPNEVWRFYQATGWHPDMHFAKRLKVLMEALAMQFGCTVSELRLDHDPPLAARPLMHKRRTGTVVYKPEANDPDHLFYRPHGPQHERSHLVKTNIRGDHGQHPDRVLIKKARRRLMEPTAKEKRASRSFFRSVAKIADPSKIVIGRPKIKSRGFAKSRSRPFQKRSKT